MLCTVHCWAAAVVLSAPTQRWGNIKRREYYSSLFVINLKIPKNGLHFFFVDIETALWNSLYWWLNVIPLMASGSVMVMDPRSLLQHIANNASECKAWNYYMWCAVGQHRDTMILWIQINSIKSISWDSAAALVRGRRGPRSCWHIDRAFIFIRRIS